MRTKKLFFSLMIIVLALTSGFLLSRVMALKNVTNSGNQYYEKIPIMKIWLNNLSLETLNESEKTVRFSGNKMTILDNTNEENFSDVTIRTRGNSTWGLPKKPYQINLADKANLLELGKSRKWILLANYLDKTQLRNAIAFYIAEMLNPEYPLSGKFLKLEINDEYLGLYYLTKKIDIGKNNVDLRDRLGVLVEMDNLRTFEHHCYFSVDNECLVLKDAVDEDVSEQAMQDFVTDFNKLELAAYDRDFETVANLIDLRSFAEYFLLNEFAVNPDAYSSSFYMYKDGPNGKIHAGPAWDFDYAFGNRDWQWAVRDSFYSPEEDLSREPEAMGITIFEDGKAVNLQPDWAISRLFYNLMKIPEFKAEVETVYRERLFGREEELIHYIGMMADAIADELKVDHQKWEISDAESELLYLLDWVERRYAHFERVYGNSENREDDTELIELL